MVNFLPKILRSNTTVISIIRRVSQTVSNNSNWRERKHVSRNPNKSGPLTDLPDYTFLDGKITSLGSNQKKRVVQQRNLVATIVTLSKEMDSALERYERLQQEKEHNMRARAGSKLKPKGHLLLSK
ncbi:39S ribosomal protein L52, mitochondrial [Toxorhynchites rutilus septentrionalis]|uniref:39S ribosomal protein L52, mitochondrial n=1 Tax=Toxorhynchites rutilus septentrionalis TaxID=329112 RepID=UPI00247AAED7|nr:39S ribosomal protein L52, mitochondrial [Toxorhynchites rutilus septentrionalis]